MVANITLLFTRKTLPQFCAKYFEYPNFMFTKDVYKHDSIHSIVDFTKIEPP